jgi:hypothetical protein
MSAAMDVVTMFDRCSGVAAIHDPNMGKTGSGA